MWLRPSAVEDMLNEASARSPLETGGVLLGYIAPATAPEEVMVEAVIGPGPHSRHFKRRFEPDNAWQTREIAARYEASGRITTYLGDWHTHPGGVPLPSRRDQKTARTIARTKSARMAHPLMLILGSNPDDDWRLVVYRSDGRRLKAVESEPRTA